MKHSVTPDRVRELHKAHLARYSPADARQATRTEVHALLQLECPPPYHDRPAHLPQDGLLSHAQTREYRDHQRSQPTDQECLDFARARSKDPCVEDPHHHAQKRHGIALWRETDRLISACVDGSPS
jgi:hypothetical protein